MPQNTTRVACRFHFKNVSAHHPHGKDMNSRLIHVAGDELALAHAHVEAAQYIPFVLLHAHLHIERQRHLNRETQFMTCLA